MTSPSEFVSVDVVRAEPGYYAVYEDEADKSIDCIEPIIAWRIETYQAGQRDELRSSCVPLTVDGDVLSNCIGVQNPDKSITVFEHATYSSLSELIEERSSR